MAHGNPLLAVATRLPRAICSARCSAETMTRTSPASPASRRARALTEPPPGYQTPSPDQPYGVGKEPPPRKPTNYLERHGTRRRPIPTDRVSAALPVIVVACRTALPRVGERSRLEPARIRKIVPFNRIAFLAAVAVLRRGARDAVARRRAGRRPDRRLHAGERTGAGRHSRPPRAGGHPHDLVQGRRRRRDAGQVGARAFPRTSDVQGHGEESDRPFLASGRHHRRPGKRLHLERLHRLFTSACRASSSRP